MSNGTSQKLEFDLADLDEIDDPELYPTGVDPSDELAPLATLVSRTTSLCSIEFLKTEGNDVKPHVVFNLKLNPQQSQFHEPVKGCRLSMEYGHEEGFRGTFMIKALPYMGSSNRALAPFDFKVNTQITIRDWIQIFRGRHQRLPTDQRTDITEFEFVSTPPENLMDGCRDFICQCFLRAYRLGIVQGYSSSLRAIPESTQVLGFRKHIRRHPELLGDPDSFWFFDIIDKNFRLGSYEKCCPITVVNEQRHTIMVIPTPMHRGVFLDPGFRRIEAFDAIHRFPLQYISQPAAQDTAGNNGQGGAPGGAGGAGGGGGAGDSPQGGPGQAGVPPSNGSGSGSGAGHGGPTGGPPGNQLGTGMVSGTPTPTNPGIGLAPVKEIGAQTGAPLTSRPKIPDTVTAPPAMTTQTRPPSAQTATATKVSLAGKRDADEDCSSSEGYADEGSPLKRTKG